jgi:hypothetical protein
MKKGHTGALFHFVTIGNILLVVTATTVAVLTAFYLSLARLCLSTFFTRLAWIGPLLSTELTRTVLSASAAVFIA